MRRLAAQQHCQAAVAALKPQHALDILTKVCE